MLDDYPRTQFFLWVVLTPLVVLAVIAMVDGVRGDGTALAALLVFCYMVYFVPFVIIGCLASWLADQ